MYSRSFIEKLFAGTETESKGRSEQQRNRREFFASFFILDDAIFFLFTGASLYYRGNPYPPPGNFPIDILCRRGREVGRDWCADIFFSAADTGRYFDLEDWGRKSRKP